VTALTIYKARTAKGILASTGVASVC
jgi:hypothetical protein